MNFVGLIKRELPNSERIKDCLVQMADFFKKVNNMFHTSYKIVCGFFLNHKNVYEIKNGVVDIVS